MVCRIDRLTVNKKGFTLIEVIVSLVLVGLLAAIVGIGLVRIAQGYIIAKQNSESVQKAQIAMTRMVKELGAAEPQSGATSAILEAGAKSVHYTRRTSAGSGTFIENTIAITGGMVQMSGTANGTLTDNIVSNSSSFRYFDVSGTELSAPVATPANIRRIDISLRVTVADNITSDYTNSVWINEFY